MAALVTGSKTCTLTIAPHLTGTALTTLLAIALEDLTVKQFTQIADALGRVPHGHAEGKTLGQLLG